MRKLLFAVCLLLLAQAPPPRKGKSGGKRQGKPTAELDQAVAES